MAQKYEPPPVTTTDAAASGARALLRLVPAVGSAAMELLNVAISSPLERRRDDWMRTVGAALEAAEVKIQELAERADFVDTFIVATAAALRTSSDEKRTALRNAVVNAATRSDPAQDERHMFLQLVDRFTPSHLSMLTIFTDPIRWAEGRYKPAYSSNLIDFVEAALPQLKGRRDFAGLVWAELGQAGLASSASLAGSRDDDPNGLAGAPNHRYGQALS